MNVATEAAQYAKIRPMRVEMFLRVQIKTSKGLLPSITRKNIAAGSGETTDLEMILAVLN